MGLFCKTTSIDFQEFGEVFTDTSLRNELANDREYISISGSSTNFLLVSNDETYFKVKEGIAAVIVTKDLNEKPKAFIIHRVCHLYPGLYYNFVSISNESVIEVIDYNPRRNRHKIEEYNFPALKSNIVINSVLGSYFVVRGPNYSFPGEIHNFWEITYMDNGELTTYINNKEYLLKDHNLLFFAPGEQHSCKTDNSCSYLTIVFDMNIDEADALKLKDKVFTINAKERDLLAEINRINNLSDIQSTNSFISTLQLLICELLKPETSRNSIVTTSMSQNYNNELLNEIVIYIGQNIYENITVEDLCYKFGLSRSSIQLLFKENLDVLPKQYISDLKFAKAKQMMKDSTYSISQVAKFCGFSSIHYFSRKFKEKYGVTPSSYAKSIG